MLKKSLITGIFTIIIGSVSYYANKTRKQIFDARIECNKLKIIKYHVENWYCPDKIIIIIRIYSYCIAQKAFVSNSVSKKIGVQNTKIVGKTVIKNGCC